MMESRDGIKDIIQHIEDPTAAGRKRYVYLLTVVAAIGGFLFGYDTGVVSGAMIILKEKFALDNGWQELIVSITVGFAALFALLGGPANNILGRKGVILLSSAVFALGSGVLAFAVNKYMLLVGRAIVGAAIGLSSMTIPMYIAECSPPQIRGNLVTVNILFVTGGQVVASCIDGAFSNDKVNGWRYMLGLAAIPAIVQFLGFLVLPESPRWLIQKGKVNRAAKVLQKILENESKVQQEIETLKQVYSEQQHSVPFCQVFSEVSVRRALVVGCGLQMFQQLAGINTIMYYSATIIQMSGVKDDTTAIWLAAAVASVNFLGSALGLWLIERLGRRRLALFSMSGVTLSLLFMSLAFLLPAIHSPSVTLNSTVISEDNFECYRHATCETCMLDVNCGFCYMQFKNSSGVTDSTCVPANKDQWQHSSIGRCSNNSLDLEYGPFFAENYCPTKYSWMALLGMVFYLLSFSPGLGPIPWTVNSEIYPQWARSAGNAMSTGTNWIFNMLISLTFLHISDFLTYQGAFLLYASFALAGLVFIFLLLPETKGKPLEEIERLFMSGWIVKKSSRHYRVVLNNTETSDNEEEPLYIR